MKKDEETNQPAPPNRSEINAQVEDFLAVWFRVRQQVQALNFNRAHQDGLSASQFLVLALLEEAEKTHPPTISGLAGRLNLDPATVVRTVDSLEKRGLIERRRDKQDRRQVFVEFTEAGREAQHAAHRGFKDSIITIFSSMEAEGRQALVDGLQEFARWGQQIIDGTEPKS